MLDNHITAKGVREEGGGSIPQAKIPPFTTRPLKKVAAPSIRSRFYIILSSNKVVELKT